MPDQFPYPQDGWSTGTMRKVGDISEGAGALEGDNPIIKAMENVRKRSSAYPELSKEEWKAWQELPSKKGNVTAGKDRDLKGMLADNPDGFIVDRDHPGIRDIQGDAEILSIPDRDDVLFARPKPKEPLVS